MSSLKTDPANNNKQQLNVFISRYKGQVPRRSAVREGSLLRPPLRRVQVGEVARVRLPTGPDVRQGPGLHVRPLPGQNTHRGGR